MGPTNLLIVKRTPPITILSLRRSATLLGLKHAAFEALLEGIESTTPVQSHVPLTWM